LDHVLSRNDDVTFVLCISSQHIATKCNRSVLSYCDGLPVFGRAVSGRKGKVSGD